MQPSSRFLLRIAELTVEVAVEAAVTLTPGEEYEPFCVDGDPAGDLRLRYGDARGRPWFPCGERLFHAEGIWELSRSAGADREGRVLRWGLAGPGRLRCEGRFAEDYAAGEVRLDPWPGGLSLAGLPGLLEIAFQTRLARRGGGFLVHAAGIEVAGRGFLCPGSSGRGKSTLSEQLPRESVLSDERVALTRSAAGFRIHGTPWRGTAACVRAASAPLTAILFLGPHGETPGLRPLSRAEAFRRLAFHAFPPLWDRPGLGAALDLARTVAATVRAFELRHRPGIDLSDRLEEATREAGR